MPEPEMPPSTAPRSDVVVGAAAFVFGAFSLPQIKHGERRGLGFVLAALVVLAGGVAIIMIALNQLDQSS